MPVLVMLMVIVTMIIVMTMVVIVVRHGRMGCMIFVCVHGIISNSD